MNASELRIILSAISETAKDLFHEIPYKTILYGSYARGDYDSESDIDILILADVDSQECSVYRRKFSAVVDRLSLQYDIVVSLHILDIDTFERWNNIVPFYQAAESEGIILASPREGGD